MDALHLPIGDAPTLSLAPVLSLWLVIPGLIAAVVMTVMLYRSQRVMAPRRTVIFLTALRALLIVMLAILFLQPAMQWTQSRSSAGTLWIVADQSPSMATSDPQATDIERLRWARSIGLMEKPADGPDVWAAQVHALADEYHVLAPTPIAGGNERAEVRDFATRLDAWVKALQKVQSAVDGAHASLEADEKGLGDTAATAVDQAAENAAKDAASVWSANTPEEAASDVRAYVISPLLGQAQAALERAAGIEQSRNVAANASGSSWKSAQARIDATSRDELALDMLAGPEAPARKQLEKLATQYHLRIASFSEKTQAAGTVDSGSLASTLQTALTPGGTATDLGGALQYVAEQTSADEAASVVVITDGRTNVGSEPTAVARSLAARGVHVYGLLAGSHEVSPDAAVQPVDFPEWIFKGDSVKARASIRMDGLKGKTALVELRRGSEVLQRQEMLAPSNHEILPFVFTDTPPESEKSVDYEIRIQPLAGEVNTQNNVAAFRVAVKKQKLYALVVEDRPRWEFRYLATMISRRPGMRLQSVLLQPATVTGIAGPTPVMASPDNTHEEAQILPDTLEGWEKFDVIVLGDIGPETLTPRVQQFIAATVRDKGATLITIAGQHAMPEKFAGSTLADLLPVTLTPQWTSEEIGRHTRSGFHPEAAPTAGFSELAQLEGDAASSSRAWSRMPSWYWHSPFTEAKPAATALWAISDTGAAGAADPLGSMALANRHALIATISIGLGHSLYLASDQSWRLRQVAGENLHDRFWGQVLNWAVGSDLPAGGKYVRFGASQAAYDQTQPVVITARVLRDDLTPYTGLPFSAVARPAHTLSGQTGNTGPAVEASFEPMQSPGYYQATLGGLPIGDVEISLKGTEVERLLNNDPTVTLHSLLIKILPVMDAERRNMNTDPDMLEEVAEAGGGFSLDLPYADVLLSRLPKIEHKETSVLQLGFFTDPEALGTRWAHGLFLLFFAMVITFEWAWRKKAGLV